MATNAYLKWLSETASFWWNDSAEYDSMEPAIDNGCTGVTTNPLLIKRSLYGHPEFWRPYLRSAEGLKGDAKAEEILRCVTVEIAKKFQPIYERTNGAQGLVCAQVNPKKQGDTELMVEMGRRLAAGAPNIAVKLPATASGVEVIEHLAEEGIPICATINVSVAQAIAVAEAYERGKKKAVAAGVRPPLCIVVQQVGRLDDYLRDVAQDSFPGVRESDIIQSGTAAIKRAYEIFNERGYDTFLMPAGCRGTYHITELAGAKMIMSIAPKISELLLKETDCTERIGEPVAKDVIDRLLTMPEFRKAYEPDGMSRREFITFGSANRTTDQFINDGWNPLASFKY